MAAQYTIAAIFFVVYLGMILGGLPFLQLDRTGIALLGAIALIGMEALRPAEAARSIHVPTILLLFSFMVVSAQLQLGGFYPWVAREVADDRLSSTADYRSLIRTARETVARDSFDLLETLAHAVADAVVKQEGVVRVNAVVHKPGAARSNDVQGVAAAASAER